VDRVLSIVLAGGAGKRLRPLTLKQAKPAIPFSHNRRIIDFVMSNLWHSGLHQVMVLTQYLPFSLHRHLKQYWQPQFTHDGSLQLCQAAPQLDQGTAGAVASQLSLIRDYRPDVIAILSADHIYKMDYRQMLAFHRQHCAAVTVSAIAVPIELAPQFGIIETDAQQRVCGFYEKPQTAISQIPGRTGYALASMGNYLFNADYLYQLLQNINPDQPCDFGHDILPGVFCQQQACVYDFSTNQLPGAQSLPHYWRDVGTMAAYHHSQLDIQHHTDWLEGPAQQWPIMTTRNEAVGQPVPVSHIQRAALTANHPLYL
jgi:glucose-1-phosphate adenylyltransferase